MLTSTLWDIILMLCMAMFLERTEGDIVGLSDRAVLHADQLGDDMSTAISKQSDSNFVSMAR